MPGGKVDPGETNVEALIREVKGETGLDIVNIQPVFVSYDKYENEELYEVTTFVGEVSGSIQTSEEGRVAWITKEQLLNGMFGGYNESLLKHLNML